MPLGLSYPAPEEKTHKFEHTPEAERLFELYQQVRDIREQNCSHAMLPAIWDELKKAYPADWLCALEILEILRDKKISDTLEKEVAEFLAIRRNENATMAKLINDGFAMLD